MSIGEVAAQLRAAIAPLPPEELVRAIDRLENARALIMTATEGSNAWEPPEIVALLTQGIESSRESLQQIAQARAIIEGYLARVAGGGTSSAAGAGGPMAPATAMTPTATTSAPPTQPTPVRRQVDPALVAELQRLGRKISAERVVRTGRDREGRAVWMEDGDKNAGLEHLMDPDRVIDFVNKGVAESDMVDLVFTALAEGEPIGITGKNRIVYALTYRGRPQHVAITVGSNGYIIGANPVGLTRRVKPLP